MESFSARGFQGTGLAKENTFAFRSSLVLLSRLFLWKEYVAYIQVSLVKYLIVIINDVLKSCLELFTIGIGVRIATAAAAVATA